MSPPRHEDVAMAQAEVALAEAGLAEAEALLELTVIRAPIDGRILRVHKKVGETVSDARDTPILTMGDIATLRVRAEVDETDIARVAIGQPAYVRADAFGEAQFRGKVVSIRPSLDRKRIRIDSPSERLDVKILEVLIDLEQDVRLLPGLRVDVFIRPDAPRQAS
jgi:HlyD family secretion protein